jgi:hypothetical protein
MLCGKDIRSAIGRVSYRGDLAQPSQNVLANPRKLAQSRERQILVTFETNIREVLFAGRPEEVP